MVDLLAGRSVLVVEDEMMVLMMIEDLLADLGCLSVKSAATVDQALALIAAHKFDVATLDVNLNGSDSYAIADALAAQGVPFAFSTGYGDHGLRNDHRGRPILKKPFGTHEFARILHVLMSEPLSSLSAVWDLGEHRVLCGAFRELCEGFSVT